MRRAVANLMSMALVAIACSPAAAQGTMPRVVEIHMVPTARTQMAVWIERADGTFLQTLGLTVATAKHGLGNRPGALQMNSGFHWPYGRREGVLPVWAHRRAAAPGAQLFPRVIYQDRSSEGDASRTSNDFSRDDYYCLSFSAQASAKDALDAVTCPSVFNSDKGRYMTQRDVASGYAEPFQTSPGTGMMRPLTLHSLYPPRLDVTRCTQAGCYDHPDVAHYADDARRVMPEIDAVAMATPPEGVLQTMQFTIPSDWADGDYVVWVEVNTEGDYDSAWGPDQYPTPMTPDGEWDYWAENYGYPYRGQPSVVFEVPFTVGNGAVNEVVTTPSGYGSIDGLQDGHMTGMDRTITDDPTAHPGSGADRLLMQTDGGDWRVKVTMAGPEACMHDTPPGEVQDLTISQYADRLQAHHWAHLSFVVPSDDQGIVRYEVRVSTDPIVDEQSFMRALQAEAASLENQALVVPTDRAAGQTIEVDFGGLMQLTHYYVAVRAVDACNVPGPMAVAEYDTPKIKFTTVSPCFVATAAWGTPMAAEIGALRRLRDRHLRTNAVGRALVDVYYDVGPSLAGVIRENDGLRAVTRAALRPLVALAGWLDS